MLRNATTRPLFKSLVKPSTLRLNVTAKQPTLTSHFCQLNSKRPQALVTASFRPVITSVALYATKSEPPFDRIDPKAEQKVLEKQIKATPGSVSIDSSVRQVFEGSPAPKDDDMLAGIKNDLVTVKETFALTNVPRDTLYLGLAGTLPYLATSLSTVYLSFDINHAAATGTGYLFSPETARELLAIVEPIQIGYGAVIVSFLGAIHWGLEYAGYGGHHGYRRYAIGVLAPAVAWPTMLMPVEYALITQFLAFNFLYFADARASARGWCPPWYSTYRFVLTFIVGASIVVSLVGRGQIAEKNQSSMPKPTDRMKALHDGDWEKLEQEEKERRRAAAAAEEAEEDEEEEEEGDSKKDDDEEEEGDDKNKDKDEKK